MIVPRDYQETAIDASVAYLLDPKQKRRNGLVIQPTGSGKSVVIAGIATRLYEETKAPTLVFQPSKEILDQNLAKLAAYGYKAAVFSASLGRREIGPITFATIGSVIRYADEFRGTRFALADECHVVNARGGMYTDFFDVLPDARIVGLTATPFRLASNSYGSELRFLTRTIPRVFKDVVAYTQIGDLFRRGYLCPLAYEDPVAIDKTRLKVNGAGSEYTDESVQQHLFEVGFVGKLQAQVEAALASGRRHVLVFTASIDESRRLTKVVPGSAMVTAETPAGDRARILSEFRRGEIQVVSNVGVIALGFDYPELDCVILGRPTLSLAVYYQQIGRVVRPHPSKTVAHVVDMVGLVKQFGRIEDLELRAGGERGRSWEIRSGDRPLTNVYYAREDIDPKEIAKANARRRFWAKRRRTLA